MIRVNNADYYMGTGIIARSVWSSPQGRPRTCKAYLT